MLSLTINLQVFLYMPFSVLIAEANYADRLLLNTQLEKFSDDIAFTESIEETREILQHKRIQLIILDINLPQFNELEFFKKIRNPNSLNRQSAVVAYCEDVDRIKQKKLIQSGFDACLIKPVLREQLIATLELWLPSQTDNQTTKGLKQSAYQRYIDALMRRTANNVPLTTEIFAKLFVQLPEQIQLIEQALNSSDLVSAQNVTHKLNGSVSFCGFDDLEKQAYQLEKDLIEKNALQALTSFQQLKTEAEQLIAQRKNIEQFLKLFQ